ncbi:hypothetical protein RhiJN_20575 [Ceratobasidium sp. AG-Ba]|nr:hypothetical protein RhiJN_20575 [Ceratobasidium sp. AG-Ba]
MPCTPSAAGLSHSYISQWAHLTVAHSPLDIPSLDPIPSPVAPSPARGRGRMRKSDTHDEDECYTPRVYRRSAHSPAPLAPVSGRANMANPGRPRATRLARYPAAPPQPNPTLSFRRLAHKPAEAKLGAEHRCPSDVTNRVLEREHTTTTPSPDLIFNMSPVLGLDGPARPYRVASRLSGEPEVSADREIEIPVERLAISSSRPSRESPFLYSYTPHLPVPEPQYESSTAFSTSRETSDREEYGLSPASATTSALVDDLAETAACLIEPPMMPRLGRLHAKSDPLPTRVSSTSTSSRAQPIPIPKPSPRVLSDYGGVSASLASLPSAPVPAPRWAKAPKGHARADRKPRREVEQPQPSSQARDVTDEWCGTADAVPVTAQAPVPVPTRRKKRFFIAGVGESYDGDMDSELSSWQ